MKKEKTKSVLYKKENLAGYLFISPFIIGFICFTVVPIIASFGLSMTKYDILSTPKYIEFNNYVKMFTADKTFWLSFRVTFFLCIGFGSFEIVCVSYGSNVP